jgi:hypothetical protein
VEAVRTAAELVRQELGRPADGDERLQATAGGGGVDAATRRSAGISDADAQDARGRAWADPLRPSASAAAMLGQLADVADRDAGKMGNALDADSGGAQCGDVFADGSRVVPPRVQ